MIKFVSHSHSVERSGYRTRLRRSRLQKARAAGAISTTSRFGTAAKCPVCAKSVYANDPQLVLDGSQYHKACAKCAEPRCGVQLSLGNFAISGEELLCKTHMKERFLLKGQYAGGEKFAHKSPRDLSTAHLFILSCQVPIAAATAAAVLKLQEKGATDRQVARVAAVAAAEEAAATASVQNSSSSSSSSGGGGGGGSGDGEWELVLGMCGQINGTTWKVVAR